VHIELQRIFWGYTPDPINKGSGSNERGKMKKWEWKEAGEGEKRKVR
jgi:hypothetical protein